MKRERHLDRDRGWGPGHWASRERLCRGARRNRLRTYRTACM